MLEFKDSWVEQFSLIEFAYTNSYQANIGMAPCEALYGRNCKTPICWDKVGERKLSDVVEVISEKIRIIQDRLKTTQDQ